MMCKQNSIIINIFLELMCVRMHLGLPEFELKLGMYEVTNK